jgi:hypothetical protein
MIEEEAVAPWFYWNLIEANQKYNIDRTEISE